MDIEKIKSFFAGLPQPTETGWKYIKIAIVAIVLLVAAFATGRYTVPTKIVEQRVEVEKKVEVVRIDEQKVLELTAQLKIAEDRVAELNKKVHKTEHTVKKPDGTVEVTKTEDTDTSSSSHSHTDTTSNTTEKQVEIKYVDRIVEVQHEVVVTKIVDAEKPQWLIGPMVGVNFRDLTVPQGVFTGPFSFGATVERRIAGPVFVGVWGVTSGQVGISALIEF